MDRQSEHSETAGRISRLSARVCKVVRTDLALQRCFASLVALHRQGRAPPFALGESQVALFVMGGDLNGELNNDALMHMHIAR